MPKTKNFRVLHQQVMARPGAAERLAALHQEALAEIGLYELQSQHIAHVDLADRLLITSPTHAEDVRLSTLRQYIEALGGRLELSARFDDRVVPIDIEARPGVA